MRICLIGKGVPRIPPKPGIPVTIYIHTLALELGRLGHQVDVICAPAPGKEVQPYNIVELGKPRLSTGNPYLQSLYELWYSLSVGLALPRLARRRGYDVIHFLETPATAFAALLLAGRSLAPTVFSSGRPVSGTELRLESQNTPLPIRLTSDLMHSYVFRRVKRVTTSSHRLKEVLVHTLGIDPGKISVTPFIAAEPELFHPGIDCSALRQKLGLGDNERVVLSLGEVSPYKNQLSLVRAIPRVIEKHPETRFVLAGGILKEYHAELARFIRAHSLEDYVIFTGFISDYSELPQYYNLADIYVLLSRSEGNLPKTILEAMSCARPVIAADIPQNREGAKMGDEIIFVPPYDIEAIAGAVSHLLSSPESRKKLGESARRTVMAHHTPEVIGRGMERTYREIARVKEGL